MAVVVSLSVSSLGLCALLVLVVVHLVLRQNVPRKRLLCSLRLPQRLLLFGCHSHSLSGLLVCLCGVAVGIAGPVPAAAAGGAGDVQIPIGAVPGIVGGAGVVGGVAHDPARCLLAFQLSRIVKLFAVVDGCFLLIWSFSFTPLLAAVALCAAGYYGAHKYKLGYLLLV